MKKSFWMFLIALALFGAAAPAFAGGACCAAGKGEKKEAAVEDAETGHEHDAAAADVE